MDHTYSRREYVISCILSMLYAGLVAASYFDISTCPYVYGRPTLGALHNSSDSASSPSAGGGVDKDSADSHKSLFVSLASEGGLTCHMVDVLVWAYIAGLLIFLTHKYITYRVQGLHYFFLDYCYFHNAVLVCFLLWRLVDVQWSEEPVISWASRPPTHSSTGLGAEGHGSEGAAKGWTHPLVAGTPMKEGQTIVRRLAPEARRSFALDGIYRPVSVDILTCGYVVSHLTELEMLSSFVVFFTLMAGTFGPILGAILMWKNALLFHSFDRMSSSYLHLAPGIVQSLLLHRVFVSARQEMMSLDATALYEQSVALAEKLGLAVENLLPAMATLSLSELNATAPTSAGGGKSALAATRAARQQRRFLHQVAVNRMDAMCGAGTLCYDLRRAVSFTNLLQLHFFMFCVWQVFYHVFNEYRRLSRERAFAKRLKKMMKDQAEFMQLTNSTRDEAELLRESMVMGEGVGGHPADRVTSYTWMMQHPPGGKKGLPYRFVTCLGMSRFTTTALFQLTQWLLHMVFFTWSYPFIYFCFHYAFSAGPLLVYVLAHVCVCVFNAATMDQKWISKLQQMATKGMEAERQDQLAKSMTAAAAAASSAKKKS